MFRNWKFCFLLLGFTFLTPSSPAQSNAREEKPPKTVVSPSTGPERSPAATNGDALIRNIDYPGLAKAIAAMPPSIDRDYFAGVLANRTDDVEGSITLLNKTLPQIEKSNPRRAAVALLSLADDYIKTFRYVDAVRSYKALLDQFSSQLEKEEKQSTEDDYKAAILMRDAPPQTVDFHGPVDLPTERNPVLGTINTTLTVNGVPESWVIDTGANFSTVSASFARKLGVPMSEGVAQTQGITGAENPLHVAILPELHLGGATVHNVVLLVLDDASLNVPTGPKTKYQIHAILGFPVLHALQRITFTKNGHLLAGPSSPSGQSGAPLYMKELTPLLQCQVRDRNVLFSFDTGAGQTILSNHFRQEFPSIVAGLKPKSFSMGGAGGIKEMETPYIPELTLVVGETRSVIHQVPVIGVLGTDMDRLFGNLGRDLVEDFESFTIDFEQMRFALGNHLQPAKSSVTSQLENCLTVMDQAASDFQTLEANFIWDQYQAVVQDHDLQEGKMFFRRNGRNVEMAADITKPNKKYILFADGIVQLYVPPPGADQITKYNPGKNRADFESFLVLGFGGRGHDLEKSFAVRYLGTEKIDGQATCKLELSPKTQAGKNLFQVITLWIDESRGFSLQQKFEESSGDYRLANYKNIKLNEILPPEVFKLKTTSKTTVVTPQG